MRASTGECCLSQHLTALPVRNMFQPNARCQMYLIFTLLSMLNVNDSCHLLKMLQASSVQAP